MIERTREETHGETPGERTQGRHEHLLRVVRRVRARWRARRILRGVAFAALAGLGALALGSYAIDAFRYAPAAVRVFQVAAWALLLAALVRFLFGPLRTRVSDRQVALYIEEHDPSLREAVLSGVELGGRRPRPSADAGDTGEGTGASPELTRLVVEKAIHRLEGLKSGRAVESNRLNRDGGILLGVAAVALLASLFGPPAFRHGAALMFAPWLDLSSSNPYRLDVEPGDAVIARGSDLWIEARLSGFETDMTDGVELLTRRGDGDPWVSEPMIPDPDRGSFRRLLLALNDVTYYRVVADGVRSPEYRVDVEELPQVARISVTYRYPAHVGLSDRVVEDGGDVAAVRGAEVVLGIHTTTPVEEGTLRFNGRAEELPLRPSGPPAGVGDAPPPLEAAFRVEEDDAYRIALPGPDGGLRTASRDYAIEVLEDHPPIVLFLRPARDIQASPVEEVFTEARAEDDYAVRSLALRYSVNGGEEIEVPLAASGSRGEVQAGHTIFLEEMGLVPGDLVAYHAVAVDGAGATAATDMFFIGIRPFDRTYRQADSMPGGAGGEDGLDGMLSVLQKQIVVGVFALLRDRDGMSAEAISETVATLGLAQGRLRERVSVLARRLRDRGIARNPEFEEMAVHLEAALGEMEASEELLVGGDPDAALPHATRALTHVQRADAVFREVQVAFGQNGGPGGGGAPPLAEDLAGLFELEIDRFRNQYETRERAEQAASDDQVDEVMERLAELARRQQQENERRRQGFAGAPGSSGGGSGARQRELAEEVEEAARELQRLSRNRDRPDFDPVARRLQDAARAMREAAAAGGEEGLARGLAAADSLRSARRDLDGRRRERLARDLEETTEQVRRLRQAQERIRSGVGRLDENDGSAGAGGRDREEIAALHRQKDELAGQVEQVERRLDEVAREFRGEEPEAARAAGEAAAGVRNRKLKEKIHYSKGLAESRSAEYASMFEDRIAEDLEALEREVLAAGNAARGSDRAGRNRVLEQAGELVRGLEGLRNRLAERSDGERRGEDGRDPGASADSSSEGGAVGADEGESDGERQAGAEGGADSEASESRPSEESGSGAGGGGLGEARVGERQLARELAERARDVEALQREMSGIGSPDHVGPERLDPVLRALRDLDVERLVGGPRGMEILEAEVLDSLRRVEFELRRHYSGGASAETATSVADAVPEGYEEMVEEYFRALSRSARPRP